MLRTCGIGPGVFAAPGRRLVVPRKTRGDGAPADATSFFTPCLRRITPPRTRPAWRPSWGRTSASAPPRRFWALGTVRCATGRGPKSLTPDPGGFRRRSSDARQPKPGATQIWAPLIVGVTVARGLPGTGLRSQSAGAASCSAITTSHEDALGRAGQETSRLIRRFWQ